MKDPRAIAFLIVVLVVTIAALVYNGFLLYRRKKNRGEVDDAVIRVMKNYKVITLSKALAIIAIGKLTHRDMKNICYEIYEDCDDSNSFHFVIRLKTDKPVREPKDRFIVEATSENYSEVISKLSAR